MLVMTFKQHVRSHCLIRRSKYVWSHMELIFLAKFSRCMYMFTLRLPCFMPYSVHQLTHILSNSLNIDGFQREIENTK